MQGNGTEVQQVRQTAPLTWFSGIETIRTTGGSPAMRIIAWRDLINGKTTKEYLGNR